jgi:hypothetical protein
MNMNREITKNAVLGLVVCAAVAGSIIFFISQNNTEVLEKDYHGATYRIEGHTVTLNQSAVRFFGNEVFHDLNDDGREDVVFLLTQNQGGSGTFYYVVAALNTTKGYRGSEAFLLGDRISPQSTYMDEGTGAEGRKRQDVIVVNYADRAPGEPMTTRPSVGKSVWLKLDPKTMQFAEVAQNFEGESR